MAPSKEENVETIEYISNPINLLSGNKHGDLLFENLSQDEMRTLEKGCTSPMFISPVFSSFFLLRKIDLHLITALFGIFIFNILDRANIASARLGGMEKDLHLTDSQYQTCVSVLFVGYLLGQIPSNLVLSVVRPSIYLPTAILIWGSISTCTAATNSFGGLFAVRFFLGFAESPFFAGALFLISSWYKPSEIAPRVAVMYCGNTVANGFGGLLAAGVLSGLDGAHGIAGWRWLYIIEGAGTIATGILAFILLPDFPDSKRINWLSEQEQRFSSWRLAVTANGQLDEAGSIKEGLRDALTDVKVWLLVAVQICLLSSETWTYFFPSIVDTLGYSSTISLLLTAPPYIFGFLTSLGNSFLAQYTGRYMILTIWPLMLDVVGNVMVISSHVTAIRYIGMFFMCAGSFSAFNVIQAWIGSTVPRTRTKRAVAFALVNVIGNSANIYGPYFFPASSSPQYVLGGVALSSFAAGGSLFAVVLAWYLNTMNKRATAAEDEDGVIRYRYGF